MMIYYDVKITVITLGFTYKCIELRKLYRSQKFRFECLMVPARKTKQNKNNIKEVVEY